MPIYREAGKDASIVVPFKVDGEYVAPDAASVKYTVYDNSGASIPSLTDVAVTTTSTTNTIALTVLAINNALGGLVTSNRTVVVSFLHNLHPYTYRTSYVLHSFLNFSVNHDDCRAALGFDSDEMPDHEVDLVSAYFRLKSQVSTLDAHLSAGGLVAQAANEAVKYQACLDAMPAIRRRVAKRRTVDGVTVERADTDLNRLEADLHALLGAAVAVATSADTTLTIPSLLVVGTRTDILTGA